MHFRYTYEFSTSKLKYQSPENESQPKSPFHFELFLAEQSPVNFHGKFLRR